MRKRITTALLLILAMAMLITGCRPPSNQSRGDGGTQPTTPQSSPAPQSSSAPQGDIDADIDIEEIERFLDELEDDFAEADEILGQFR